MSGEWRRRPFRSHRTGRGAQGSRASGHWGSQRLPARPVREPDPRPGRPSALLQASVHPQSPSPGGVRGAGPPPSLRLVPRVGLRLRCPLGGPRVATQGSPPGQGRDSSRTAATPPQPTTAVGPAFLRGLRSPGRVRNLSGEAVAPGPLTSRPRSPPAWQSPPS